MLISKLNKGFVGLGVDYGMLFDPADLVLLGLDLEEAAGVVENFQLLTVDHLAYAIRNGGHPVMQIGLAHGDVDRIVLQLAKSRASRGQYKKA